MKHTGLILIGAGIAAYFLFMKPSSGEGGSGGSLDIPREVLGAGAGDVIGTTPIDTSDTTFQPSQYLLDLMNNSKKYSTTSTDLTNYNKPPVLGQPDIRPAPAGYGYAGMPAQPINESKPATLYDLKIPSSGGSLSGYVAGVINESKPSIAGSSSGGSSGNSDYVAGKINNAKPATATDKKSASSGGSSYGYVEGIVNNAKPAVNEAATTKKAASSSSSSSSPSYNSPRNVAQSGSQGGW